MDGELIREEFIDVDWKILKFSRSEYLSACDHFALQDRVMSEEVSDYRQFLRDLPQNFDTANDALDAWTEYEVPVEALP
jgi:hypothetical protein